MRHPVVQRMEAGRRYTLGELREVALGLNPAMPKSRFRSLVGALVAEGQVVKTGQRRGARWQRADS